MHAVRTMQAAGHDESMLQAASYMPPLLSQRLGGWPTLRSLKDGIPEGGSREILLFISFRPVATGSIVPTLRKPRRGRATSASKVYLPARSRHVISSA